MENFGVILVLLILSYYVFQWLELPSKVKAIEVQLKRIGDILEKQNDMKEKPNYKE